MALLNSKEHLAKLDRVGRLDRRITFIEREITDGTSNEDYTGDWVEVDSNPDVWARKADLRGKEVVIADQVKFMYLTIWTVRYRSDLNAMMRVVDESGQVYEIITISEGEGRRQWTDIVTNIIENKTWT